MSESYQLYNTWTLSAKVDEMLSELCGFSLSEGNNPFKNHWCAGKMHTSVKYIPFVVNGAKTYEGPLRMDVMSVKSVETPTPSHKPEPIRACYLAEGFIAEQLYMFSNY